MGGISDLRIDDLVDHALTSQPPAGSSRSGRTGAIFARVGVAGDRSATGAELASDLFRVRHGAHPVPTSVTRPIVQPTASVLGVATRTPGEDTHRGRRPGRAG